MAFNQAQAQTNTVTSTTGTTVIDKTPPTANAPGVVVNNSDVCKSAFRLLTLKTFPQQVNY